MTPCEPWTGAVNRHGYGQVWHEGRMCGAHRVAFEQQVGPIPAGLHLDHLCHNADSSCPGGRGCEHRRCVNVEHLEPVTVRDNLFRSPLTLAVKNGTRTHCVHGHEFTAENTYVWSNGRRRMRTCKACAKARATARRSA